MNTYSELLGTVSALAGLEIPHVADREEVLGYIEAIENVALADGIVLPPEQAACFLHEPIVCKIRDRYELACTAAEDFDQNNSDLSLDSFLPLEAEALGVSTTSKVALVGCGSVPQSAVAYSHLAGHVTGIDYRPEAVATACTAIEGLPNIDIEEGRGETYNYSSLGLIVISLMVRDKTRVLEQIASTAKPGTRVAVRTVVGLRTLLHEPLGRVPTGYLSHNAVYDPPRENLYHVHLLEVAGS
jgi:hypothetical protein